MRTKMRAALVAALMTGCSGLKAPEPTRLDSVLVNVDGVDHKVPLEEAVVVPDVRSLKGACLTPDLKHARLLTAGKECDDGWVTVKGNTAK